MKIFKLLVLLIIIVSCNNANKDISCIQIDKGLIDSIGVEYILSIYDFDSINSNSLDTISFCNNQRKIIAKAVKHKSDTISLISLHKSGSINTIGKVHNKEKEGEWKSYYENRQLRSKASFANDKIKGEMRMWYENGNIKNIINHMNGKMFGEFISYYSNGQTSVKTLYQNDVLNGTIQVWHENGTQSYIGKYEYGKEVGEWTYWNQKGKLVKIEYYDNGELVKVEEY